MNKKDLYKEIGLVDDGLVEEALQTSAKKTERFHYKKVIAIAAAICVFLCSSVTALALNYVQQTSAELYIRYLSPETLNLNQDGDGKSSFDADKFFEALQSGNTEYQYIAINKLVECFNDDALRKKAIQEITPFVSSPEKKLADAAAFSLDILSKSYKSDMVYPMADGSVYFTLFNNYSDYGSYTELWRIQDGKLEKYFAFDKPSMYITRILPSPDKKLLAITTCSNKSEYIVLLDPSEGMVSPELMDSARILYANTKGYTVLQRIDHENYSSIGDISWKNSGQIQFNATLSYNDTDIMENVSVVYDYAAKSFNIQPQS
jgi:WD40 repeat protein